MKKQIYVLGFPKSGNTWLARLIAEITNSNIEVFGRDNVNSADNSKSRTGEYLIIKDHRVRDLEKVLEQRVVYIVRDIRDVLVSGFFHSHRSISEESVINNIIIKKYFNYEIIGLNKQWQGNFFNRMYAKLLYIYRIIFFRPKEIQIGSWSKHVNFWTKQKGVYVVSYEKLFKDTEKEMKILFKYLGIDVSDKAIRDGVDKQSFEKKKKKFIEKGDKENAKFMRSGGSGSWKKLLDINILKLIEESHGDVMKKFGYN